MATSSEKMYLQQYAIEIDTIGQAPWAQLQQMAQSPSPVPVPRPRLRRAVKNLHRQKLVDLFEGFSAGTVSDEQIQTARECIHHGGSPSSRYIQIPFEDILSRNENKTDHLTLMTSAYDLLLKYVINLMKPRRPQVWRSIKTNNTAFKARVACMEGAKDILKTVGYSVVTDTAMQFPEEVVEPDRTRLEAIAAELLMAKLEVDELNTQPPPHPQRSPQVSHSREHPNQLYQGSGPQTVSTISDSAHLFQHSSSYESSGSGAFVSQGYTTQIEYNNQVPQEQRNWQNYQTEPPEYVNLPNLQQHVASKLASTPPRPAPHPDPTSPTSPTTPTQSGPRPVPKPRKPRPPSSGGISQYGSSSREDIATGEATPNRPLSASSHRTDSLDSVTSTESSRSDSVFPAEPGCSLSSHQEALKKIKQQREQMHKKPTRSEHFSTPENHDRFESKSRTAIISTANSGDHYNGHSALHRLSSENGIKRPPGKRHPNFTTDSILEVEEPSEQYCKVCKCKLNPGDSGCKYCSNSVDKRNLSGEVQSSDPPVAQRQTPPTTMTRGPQIPPHAKAASPTDQRHDVAASPIVRASPQAAEEVEQKHRMSQLHRVNPLAMAGTTGAIRMQQPFEIRTEPFQLAGTTRVQPAATRIPYGGHEKPDVTAARIPYGDRETPGSAAPEYCDPQVGDTGASSSSAPLPEASGLGGAGGTSVFNKQQSYEEYLAEKEKYWKASQLKHGVKAEDLQPLPERLEYEKKKQQKSHQKPHPDVSQFERVDQVALSKYQREEEEVKRMEKLERDGKDFLRAVKVCLEYGFTMPEVQIAFRNPANKDPLHYLQQEWTRTIRNIQFYVSAYGQEPQVKKPVGEPSFEEARKCLIEADGVMMDAVDSCYQQRKEKTEELLKRMGHHPMYPLTWEGAVQALVRNGMNVDSACWAIQCDTLQPLYEYIFSEWNMVKQQDMEKMKGLIKRKGIDEDACHRLLMAECRLESHEKAHMVFQLMEEVEADGGDYPLGYFVDAAKDHKDIEKARKYLIKPCPICECQYPVHEMVNMPGCTDILCKDCFRMNFTMVINEQSVKHFNCPMCSEPDLANRDDTQAMYLELFVSLIKLHLDRDTYQRCQDKLTDFNLSKEDGFRWCANDKCRSGFINERPDVRKLQCPNCQQFMCFQCKKPWEDQHNDISCEEFAQWKKDNDPEAQQQGLAAHLTANGIECPACHMRYDLARGGCMHFRCTQCPNEFCSGCGGSFKNGKACGRFESCAARGLHAHHPRDCLFYLRDFTVKELQDFLRGHKVEFDTEPPQAQLDAVRQNAAAEKEPPEGDEAAVKPPKGDEAAVKEEEDKKEEGGKDEKVELKCCVMLQKELAEGLTDEECGRAVEEGHAGLCETHYKEYLVDKINKAKLDPITIYETIKIKLMLSRDGLEVPDKDVDGEEEDEDTYRERLVKHVQDVLPLDRK